MYLFYQKNGKIATVFNKIVVYFAKIGYNDAE